MKIKIYAFKPQDQEEVANKACKDGLYIAYKTLDCFILLTNKAIMCSDNYDDYGPDEAQEMTVQEYLDYVPAPSHLLLPEQARKAAYNLGYPWIAEDKYGVWRMFIEKPSKYFHLDTEVSKGVKILVDIIYSGEWQDSLLGIEDSQDKNYVPEPEDKDFVWCWNNEWTHTKTVRFYDAKTRCAFGVGGIRDGSSYDNYEVIPRDQWPDWAVKAYEGLDE